MKGWKTWLGFASVLGGTVAFFLGMTEIAITAVGFGVPMMGVGIAHKIEKGARASAEALLAVADQLKKINP